MVISNNKFEPKLELGPKNIEGQSVRYCQKKKIEVIKII